MQTFELVQGLHVNQLHTQDVPKVLLLFVGDVIPCLHLLAISLVGYPRTVVLNGYRRKRRLEVWTVLSVCAEGMK